MKKTYYLSLDGLRAVAVGIVLLAHAGSPYPRSGGVGVDIFFVLSGFLITMILNTEYDRRQKISLKNFYIRRFLRLYPCLILTCIFFAVLYVITVGQFPGRILLIVLTYTANWARALYDANLSLLTHTWSLAMEEQFYLMWPLVIISLNQHVKRKAISGLILFSGAIFVAYYRFLMVGAFSVIRIFFGLDTHFDVIVIGAALSYFVAALPQQKLLLPYSQVVGYFGAPVSVLGLAGIMATITWTDPWMGRFGFLLAGLFSATIILDLVAGSHSLFRGFLRIRVLVWTGRISYGLYLWHFPVFYVTQQLFPGIRGFSLFLLKIGFTYLVAAISYYLVEKHFLNLKRHFVAQIK